VLKIYNTSQIRNIALAGHTASGKTSMTEALLWALKQSDRLGKTEDGNTLSDFDAEEMRRHISIQASIIPVEHDGTKINLIDLPGFRDFIGEIKGGLRAADSMLLVYDATGGFDTGAEFAWNLAEDLNLPRAIFINKLDKEHTSFEKSLATLQEALGVRLVPVAIPVGEELGFKGVIDLIRMKKVNEEAQKVSYEEIPADMADEAQLARSALIEAAAEGDDELMMKFLDEQPLEPEEVIRGLKGAIAERRAFPVLCGSVTGFKGVHTLLDFMAQFMPDPSVAEAYPYTEGSKGEEKEMKITPSGPASAFVFKTVSDPFIGRLSFFKVIRGTVKADMAMQNVNRNKVERLANLLSAKGKKTTPVESLAAGDIGAVAKLEATGTFDTLVEANAPAIKFKPIPLPKPTVFMAVRAKSRGDEDKMGMGFHRLMEQDPTLNLYRDDSIRQTILSGMGEVHLQVAVGRMKDISKVDVELEIPKVPYRETITKKGEGQGKYKKQSGGHGQYGDCHIRFEPLPEGKGFEFVWEIVGGVIPTNFKSAIEKGLVETMQRGILAGAPTVDLKAACFYGSYHDVDSSDMSFKVAASLAFKNVIPHCGPILLEPIYKVRITIPEEYMGDVMGDLNGRRGRIAGMDTRGGMTVIKAQVPMAEMLTYEQQLTSATGGRGAYHMEYSHYEEVPQQAQQKIIAAYKAEKGEETEEEV
jgi:elongation factor G